MRVLQVDATLEPGSLAGKVQPASPDKSVHVAQTLFLLAVL